MDLRWLTAGILVVVLVGGIGATSAGVLPFDAPFDVNDSEESDAGTEIDEISEIDDVVAYPDPGLNGAYAVFDDDGKVAIDLTEDNPHLDGEGVPSNAFTGIDDVIRLEYTGTETAEVWLESEGDHVEFHANDESIQGESNAVTLGPNEPVAIGFSVDSTDLEAGDRIREEFSIRANVPQPDEVEDDEDDEARGPKVEVETPDNETRVVTVRRGWPGTVHTADLESLEIGTHLTLESFTLTTREYVNTEFTITADHDTERFDAVAELPKEKDVVDLGSYAIVDGPDESAVSSVEFTYALDREWVEANGIDPEDTTLVKRGTKEATDEWERFETEVVAKTDEKIFLTATLDSFSVHAFALDIPAIVFEDGTIDETAVTVGDSTTVSTTVENEGNSDTEVEVRVQSDDGDGSTTISLEAGERKTVEVPYTATTPGVHGIALEYRHHLDDRVIDSGTVEIGQVEAVEGHDESSDAGSGDDIDGGEGGEGVVEEVGSLGVSGVLLVVSMLLAAVGALWRFRGSDR